MISREVCVENCHTTFREHPREVSHNSGTADSSRVPQDSFLLYTHSGDTHIFSEERHGDAIPRYQVYQSSSFPDRIFLPGTIKSCPMVIKNHAPRKTDGHPFCDHEYQISPMSTHPTATGMIPPSRTRNPIQNERMRSILPATGIGTGSLLSNRPRTARKNRAA